MDIAIDTISVCAFYLEPIPQWWTIFTLFDREPSGLYDEYLEPGELPFKASTPRVKATSQGFRNRQFVLYSTRLGEGAQDSRKLQRSRFSFELMNILKSGPSDTWPDMDIVAEDVRKKFVELRDRGEVEQLPQVDKKGWDEENL